MNINKTMETKLGVNVTPIIYDANGELKEVRPTHHNLILNSGLDNFGRYGLEENFNYFHIGTGTRTVNRLTSSKPISQNGLIVTSNGSFFTADDVGRAIQFEDNSSSTITSYIDEYTVNVADAGTLTDVDCIIWHTEGKYLEEWYKSSITYDTTSGDFNGTTITKYNEEVVDEGYAIIEMTRSIFFDFSEDKTITEAGWCNQSSATPTYGLFGRIQFDTPIDMLDGDRLTLKVTWSRNLPCGKVSADPIFGQPATWGGGMFSLTSDSPYKWVESDGTDNGNYVYRMALFENSGAYGDTIGFNGSTSTYERELSDKTYVAGSYEHVFNEAIFTNMSGLAVTYYRMYGDDGYVRSSVVMTLDDPYTIPDNTNVILNIKSTWRRTLPDFPA